MPSSYRPMSLGNPLLNPNASAFQGMMNNPLLWGGLGMLSQGPSLTPQSPFAGLSQGLAMGMAHSQRAREIQAEQERQNAALEMRREELEGKRRQREQQAAQRQGQLDAVTAHAGTGPDAGLAAAFPGVYAKNVLTGSPQETWGQPTPMDVGGGRTALVQTNSLTGQIRPVAGGGVNVDARQAAQPVFRAGPGGATFALVPNAQGGWDTQEVIAGQAPGASSIATAESKAARANRKRNDAAKAYRTAVENWRGDRMNPDLRAVAEEARSAMVEAQAQADSPGRAPTDDDRRAAGERIPSYLDTGQVVGAALGGDPFMARMDALTGAPAAQGMPTVPTPSGGYTGPTAPTTTAQGVGTGQGATARPVGTQPSPGGTFANAPPPPRVGTVEDGYRYLGGNPADPNSWTKQ